jgi:hypothetical protein
LQLQTCGWNFQIMIENMSNNVAIDDCMEHHLYIILRLGTPPLFIGPCTHRDRDYPIRSNFWKFTLLEPVFLVKAFRLLGWKGFFWCSKCGQSRWMYNILSIGKASVYVMPCFVNRNIHTLELQCFYRVSRPTP